MKKRLAIAALTFITLGMFYYVYTGEDTPIAQEEIDLHQACVVMFIKPQCHYCKQAVALMSSKASGNIKIYDITGNPALKNKMTQLARLQKTVPQIFINGKHIGGYSTVKALDSAGELEPLLQNCLVETLP